MAACATTAFVFQGQAGHLFAVRSEPAPPRSVRGSVLIVPPFAEEMNKSRRMLALLARRLAAEGWRTLNVDPYGTGDSEGDFGDARWEGWRDDLTACMAALRAEHPGPFALCGVRLGALLAAEVLQREAAGIARLLLWQPVLSGKLAMTQFLRLKLASDVISGESGGSVEVLRRSLESDGLLEVAGYSLAADLVRAIEALNLTKLLLDGSPPIRWFDVGSSAAALVSPATATAIADLRSRGIDVVRETCPGPPFWMTAEIAVAPALVDATAAALRTVR